MSKIANRAALAALAALLSAPASADEASAVDEPSVRVVATTSAVIGAPMTGRLTAFPLKDGDRFKAGDVLAEFQCDQQRAALLHAQADVAKRRDVLSTQQQLRQLGSYSKLDYQVAGSDLRAADADLAMAQANAALCSVRAPFSGRVSATETRAYQFVQVGSPMLDILDDGALEAETIVHSGWLAWLAPGLSFKVLISETGETYPAVVSRISGGVDSVSQSVKVYARIEAPPGRLLPGMSGHAEIEKPGK